MTDTIKAIATFYGSEPRSSDWLTVEQELINKFAESTLDSDWLHTDPDRAREKAPFGGTIAHGFWTMSLVTYFGRQILQQDYPDAAMYGLNYGFNRVRLMSPVPVGTRIRATTQLLNVEARGEGRYLVISEYQIHVENQQKPAMVAEWLFMLVYETPQEAG